MESKREVNGCGKVLLQRRFEKWKRRELGLHRTVGFEAVRSSEPTFARVNPFQNMVGSSKPPGSLKPTLLEARSLEQPMVCSSDPLPET